MTQNEVETWLRSGIDAAKAGQRAVARQWLTRVVRVDAHHVQAWLCLSAVVESMEERKDCLEKVLALDPNNATAHKGLSAVHQKLADQLLQDAITAARRGDRDEARRLLTQAVDYDEENVQAWLWLSRMAETTEDQQVCLENVLTLDPNQHEAQEKLATLQQVQDTAATGMWDAPRESAPAGRVAPTTAAAILGAKYIQEHTTLFPESEEEPESPTQSLWAKYDDDLLCPYCAAPTSMADQRCAACGNSLWVRTSRNTEPSVGFWILLSLILFITISAFCSPLITLYLASIYVDVPFPDLLPVYTGISVTETSESSVTPEVAAVALTVLPRITFYLAWVPFFVFLGLSIGLGLRWPPIYYLLLIFSALNVLWAALQLLSGLLHSLFSTILTAIDMAISISIFAGMIQFENDFKTDKHRIFSRVDKDINNGVGYLLRGRIYADQRMWGLAALHFRRAAGMLIYQANVQVALALACIHIREYELAQAALEEAQRIDPKEKQIVEALALLQDRRSKKSRSR